MTSSRPVVYDVTYVAARLGAATPTGIERVDAAFAAHFARGRPGLGSSQDATALHYGLRKPHALTALSAGKLLAEAEQAWQVPQGLARDLAFQAVASWLQDGNAGRRALRAGQAPARWTAAVPSAARMRWRLADDRARVPPDAIYLNVAQYAFEYPQVFRWLDRRPDVKPVFFIHDLLPLDCPEFFREGYGRLFERRVQTMARFAQAALVSNETVAERVRAEMHRRGRPDFPTLSAPLPPPSIRADAVQDRGGDELDGAPPYFVAIGTIEPRKNHLLLLHLWRALAASGDEVPRLVLVGARGWDNEQVLDLLERSPLLAPSVAEVSGLSTPGLRNLLKGARALLMPSFAEGYGLPLAEALAEGTPVVASDIPVFREVSQDKALLIDPTDGPGWRAAVAALVPAHSPLRSELLARAARYAPPAWPAYFEAIESFLADL